MPGVSERWRSESLQELDYFQGCQRYFFRFWLPCSRFPKWSTRDDEVAVDESYDLQALFCNHHGSSGLQSEAPPPLEVLSSSDSCEASGVLPHSPTASAGGLFRLNVDSVHLREARRSLLRRGGVQSGRLPFGDTCTVILDTVPYVLLYNKDLSECSFSFYLFCFQYLGTVEIYI